MMKRSLKLITHGVIAVLMFLILSVSAEASTVTLFSSHEYLARTNQIQNFQDWMNLKPGQENLPLTLHIYNGSHEIPSYKWFRITVGGYLIASEKSLKGQEYAAIDVSGAIQGGNMQVEIQAGGVAGAALWFTLTAPQVEVTSIQPTQVTAGQEIVITGNNFSSNPNQNTVFCNDKKAEIISASPTSIVAKLPSDMSVGNNEIQVNTNNLISRGLEVCFLQRPAPELISSDVWMAPPGGTVTITGRNFSGNPGRDKVYFGKVEAEVSSASFTQLVVIVPNWNWGPSQLNIPLTVVVDGVRSSNSLPIDIGPMYHGATPQFQTD